MRLVSVVTSTRSPFSTRRLISDSRSSTCVCAGRTSSTGSIRPVGRTSCSTTCPACVLLVVGRRRRDEDRLRQELLELVEAQRPVVERRRQAKAVVDQVLLARAVAPVHAADLRNRDVRLVDEHQRVGRQVVDQRRRRLAGARGPTGGANSSRCLCRSRSRASSRGRSACAARCAAPRSASSPRRNAPSAARSSTLIFSTAVRTLCLPVT